MTIFQAIDDFKIVGFYRYPTTVIDRIAEYDTGFHPGGDKHVKIAFDEMLKKAENMYGKHLTDNKIAIETIHIPTNTKFYFGYKDWNWCVGLGLSPYQTGKKLEI